MTSLVYLYTNSRPYAIISFIVLLMICFQVIPSQETTEIMTGMSSLHDQVCNSALMLILLTASFIACMIISIFGS